MDHGGAFVEKREGIRSIGLLCARAFSILLLCILSFACNQQEIILQKNDYLIVIDPGHGGDDTGEVAPIGETTEKDINLAKAKRLADYINRYPHFSAELTRNADEDITLEYRTAFANTKNADLFISLQTSFSMDVNDVELYSIGLAVDEEAINLAASENLTSTGNINDLNLILKDLIKNSSGMESSRFAYMLQKSIVAKAKECGNNEIAITGTKKAPFYVLIGATMPAVLIEKPYWAGTVAGQDTSDDWNCFCESLIKGMESYIRSSDTTGRHPAL